MNPPTIAAPTAQVKLSLEDEARIRRYFQQMLDLHLANDLEGIARLAAEDLVCMAPNVPTIMGRDGWLESAESMGFVLHDVSIDIQEIFGTDDLPPWKWKTGGPSGSPISKQDSVRSSESGSVFPGELKANPSAVDEGS